MSNMLSKLLSLRWPLRRDAQNTKHKTKQKKNKTNKTYYTEPGKCCICVFFFPPAAVFGGNMSAVAALMLARETQRIEAQGTHEGVVA